MNIQNPKNHSSVSNAPNFEYQGLNQHFTTRQVSKGFDSTNHTIVNKENKLINLLNAVELNRTSVVDQRR